MTKNYNSKYEQSQQKEKASENESNESKPTTSEKEMKLIDNNKENEQQKAIKIDSTNTNSYGINENDDNYLVYLENILQNLHDEYYKKYDDKVNEFELSDDDDEEIDESNLPDMRIVLPQLREKVLNNVVITFSGVVPTDYDLLKQKCYIMATSLGAQVNKELKFNYTSDDKIYDETTHLVAANYGTSKVHDALKMISSNKTTKQLFIVQPEWLIECYQKWAKCEEKEFALNKDYEYKNCLFHQEYNFYQQRKTSKPPQITNSPVKTESPKRPSSQQFKETKKKQKSFHSTSENKSIAKFSLDTDDSNSRPEQQSFDSSSFNFTISNNELDKMDKEVDEECSDTDNESIKKSEHSLSSSSSAASLSDSSSSTGDDESGSIDDEMVKAIERELN